MAVGPISSLWGEEQAGCLGMAGPRVWLRGLCPPELKPSPCLMCPALPPGPGPRTELGKAMVPALSAAPGGALLPGFSCRCCLFLTEAHTWLAWGDPETLSQAERPSRSFPSLLPLKSLSRPQGRVLCPPSRTCGGAPEVLRLPRFGGPVSMHFLS